MSFIYKFKVGLLFFAAYISHSPILSFFFGVSNGQIFILSCVFFILINLFAIKEKGIVFIGFIFLLLVIISVVMLSESILLFNRLIIIPISLCVFLCIRKSKTIMKDIVRVASIFAVLAIFCSVVGFFYAFTGGEPILEILNHDGRQNYLYLTTFSNSQTIFLIRPSFIYDEPGALSFILCSIVFLRELLSKGKKVTLFILFGGLITLSLAHIIICVLFIITSRKYGVVFFSVVLFSGAVFVTSQMDEFSFLYNRFNVSDGKFAGDNRSHQYSNFFKVVGNDSSIYLYGNVSCFDKGVNYCAETHGDISSSLVTPIYKAGGVAFLYQLLVNFASIFFLFSKKGRGFPLIGMMLLLAQRPFYFDPGYSLIIVLVVFIPLIVNYSRGNRYLVGMTSCSSKLSLV
jgi:hypothetical protein